MFQELGVEWITWYLGDVCIGRPQGYCRFGSKPLQQSKSWVLGGSRFCPQEFISPGVNKMTLWILETIESTKVEAMNLCLFLYPEMFILANLSVPLCFIPECILDLLMTPQIQQNFWCKSRTFRKINKQNQTCLLWQWILSLWYANFCWTLGRVLMKLNSVVLLFFP